MYALIYELSKVSLVEIKNYDEIEKYNFIEAHIFDKTQDILFKNNLQTHLEDEGKDNNKNLHFDEEMIISNVFNSMNNSNYKSIILRNYLSYDNDGIIYVNRCRLVEVKK